MAKGKSTWKYNKLLTARRNYYNLGSFIDKIAGNPDENGKLTSGLFKGMSGAGVNLLNAAGSAIGQLGGKAISGGLESGAGNVISGLQGVASAIPGPWGAVASAGLGLIGGLTNRMFGSKLNEENIASVESNINALNNFRSNASDFDTLLGNWANAVTGTDFSNSFIGEDGWFSNKAGNKANALREQVESGVSFVDRTLANNADNIVDAQMDELLGNYAAFGGELNTHGGDFTNGMTFINNGGSHETNPYEGVPMGVDPNGVPNLVEEGETVFNDYVFSKRLIVPKAVRNKYKLRGTKDMSFADASKQLAKESEERPNDPISKRGLQALMEDLASAQEELKAKNQEDMFAYGGKINKFDGGGRKRNKYKGVSGYNDNWVDAEGNYSEAYKAMVDARDAAGWNRHFNDQYTYYMNPANKGSLRWQAIDNFYSANPDFKLENIELTPEEVEWARAGSQSGPIGFMHTWGQSNSDTSVASNPESTLNVESVDNPAGNYSWMDKLAEKNPDLFGDLASIPADKKVPRNWVRIKQDDGNYGEAMLMDDAISKGLLKGYRRTSQDDKWGDDGIDNLGYYDPEEKIDLGRNKLESLRYAPAIGLGIGTITDLLGLTNSPDYSTANAVIEASRRAGTYQPVGFNPIGNYLAYNPFDRDYYLNKLNAEAGATRRAINNTSGGNRATAMAGILAADNNYLGQIGSLARQGEEYNLAQRQKTEEFNRGTNMTNSQGFLQADMANQKALMAANELGLKGVMSGYQMRDAERARADAARSANLSGLFTSIGNIGFEAKNDNMIRRLIESGALGAGAQKVYMGAYGGRLRKDKRKRGLTF